MAAMTSEASLAAAPGGADRPSDAVPIPPQTPHLLQRMRTAYRLRWKRRRLLWRAFRRRRQLRSVIDRTGSIPADAILAMATLRNEMVRLPYFLEHYRKLGVGHFLVVDNASTDGTGDYLAAQPDVSVWSTNASYRLSRFGLDWLTWLAIRHAHGHWLLTLDADEILIYPHWQTRPLRALTEWLDDRGIRSFGAMMLDMYPQGRLDAPAYRPGDDPFATLAWFDRGNYMIQRQEPMQNLWIQGGARARAFFAAAPRRAPTLNKVPLVRWNRRYAFVNSTHAILPKALNKVYDDQGGEQLCGLLLHSKFLNVVVGKSREEKARREHFHNSAIYDAYYNQLIDAPDLWCEASTRYRGWQQLEALGLMSRGLWL